MTATNEDAIRSIDYALSDENSYQDDYESRVRASSLPFCQREYVLHRAGSLAPVQTVTFFSETCTALGTALHAVAQRYMGKAGILYGNWRCHKCNTLHRDIQGTVVCCGVDTTYEEYSLKHECGITAHPDGVMLKLPNGDDFRAILEFKGSNPKKMSGMKAPLWRHGTFQANWYLNAVNDQLGLNLDKIVVIYVDRGIPSNRKYFVVKPNRAVYDNTILAVREAKEKLRLRVLPERICATPEDGKELRCAYQYLCFNPDHVLEKMIKQ